MTEPTELDFSSSHFTEVFVEQLAAAIRTVPSHQAGGIESNGLSDMLQSRIGVARGSGSTVLACLRAMRLITEVDGLVGRSLSGDRVRRELRQSGSHAIALVIIRSGYMADQIRNLRPMLNQNGDGYVCGRSAARAAAPQLVGLLARLPDVAVSGQIAIGRDAGLEIDSVWNELTPASRVNWQEIEKRRKAIGDRAELYSVQFERSSHVGAREQINWVSRDDDSLGYDIEVGGTPTRRIEVKGSAGREVQFLLSANEYRVAARHGPNFEVQFWGEVDLRNDPLEDYDRLRSTGYPIRVQDPVAAFAAEPWTIEPSQYRVARPRP